VRCYFLIHQFVIRMARYVLQSPSYCIHLVWPWCIEAIATIEFNQTDKPPLDGEQKKRKKESLILGNCAPTYTHKSYQRVESASVLNGAVSLICCLISHPTQYRVLPGWPSSYSYKSLHLNVSYTWFRVQYAPKKMTCVPLPLLWHFTLAYKRSSGRSVNKAVSHFGNSFVYKSSAIWKKPFNLRCSCTTNACMFWKTLQKLASFFSLSLYS